MLLDMSEAFDTIDHGITLDVLLQRFDVHDTALDWFASHFVDGTQVVVDSSFVSELRIGAPKGSALGLRSFVAYAEDVTNVSEQHHFRHHLFADDMQGIKQSKPSNVLDITTGLGAYISSVNNWCASKCLQLNTN